MARRKNKKANNNQRARQPRQRQQPRRRSGARQMAAVGKCTAEYARSLVNPFEVSACVPDGSRNTGLFSMRLTGTLSTGTTGSCYGIYIHPQADMLYYADSASNVGVTQIGSPAATVWSTSGSAANIDLQYQRYRPVSYGIRCSYIGSTVNDSGIIVCGTIPYGASLSNYNGMTAAQLTTASQDFQTFPLRAGAEVTYRPPDIDSVADFVDVSNASQSITVASNWPILYVAVFGATSNFASSLQYEVIVNCEGTYKLQSFIPGGIKSQSLESMAEPGWFEKAKNLVDSISQISPYMATVTGYAMNGVRTYQALRGTNTGSLVNGIARQARITF